MLKKKWTHTLCIKLITHVPVMLVTNKFNTQNIYHTTIHITQESITHSNLRQVVMMIACLSISTKGGVDRRVARYDQGREGKNDGENIVLVNAPCEDNGAKLY